MNYQVDVKEAAYIMDLTVSHTYQLIKDGVLEFEDHNGLSIWVDTLIRCYVKYYIDRTDFIERLLGVLYRAKLTNSPSGGNTNYTASDPSARISAGRESIHTSNPEVSR